MKKKTNTEIAAIEIMEIEMVDIKFHILGRTPLIMNRLSEKARQELLLPAAKKNNAEKQAALKHDPIFEFRSSMYRTLDNSMPTRVHVPARAFAGSLASAALDIPGAAKAQISRLTKVPGFNISLYGIPELYTTPVRQSDINRTPDIRTRAIFPQWACILHVSFVKGLLTERTIVRLLAGAGKIVGVGDDRAQKGPGDFGCFDVVDANNLEFRNIMKTAGLKQQDAAIQKPKLHDLETEELIYWFVEEAKKREKRCWTVDVYGQREAA